LFEYLSIGCDGDDDYNGGIFAGKEESVAYAFILNKDILLGLFFYTETIK
jgi:hypothetical protein